MDRVLFTTSLKESIKIKMQIKIKKSTDNQ